MNFFDTKTAYRHMSNSELLRAYSLFKTIQVESLTLVGTQIVRGLMKVGLPINWAIKPTIFRHFVGGETIEDCRELIDKQFKWSVKTILDYSVEGLKTEQSFDHSLAHFKRSIDYIAKWGDRIPFAVFKPSALGDASLVKMLQEKGRLTDSEMEKFEVFRARVAELCEYAFEKDVPILVDAEESWLQVIYDEIVLEQQRKFNKNKAIVYTTMQLYRTDKLAQLKSEIEMARREGFTYAVKLVRGAYMEKEREYAEDMGTQSPIHDGKAGSDRAFDEALTYCLENVECCSLVVGSHNQASNQLAAEKMKDLGIPVDDKRVFFSQLLGMADHISYNLANDGYNVAKYVPYGPVKEVLPYLFRRAEENSSVQGQAPLECELLTKELKRRKKK